MSLEAVLLIVVAIGLLVALTAARESVLLAAVAAYAGVLIWLLFTEIGLLLPGLVVAIVLGAAAIGRRLHHEIHAPADTNGHNCHTSS
jgi:hypothetical protein